MAWSCWNHMPVFTSCNLGTEFSCSYSEYDKLDAFLKRNGPMKLPAEYPYQMSNAFNTCLVTSCRSICFSDMDFLIPNCDNFDEPILKDGFNRKIGIHLLLFYTPLNAVSSS